MAAVDDVIGQLLKLSHKPPNPNRLTVGTVREALAGNLELNRQEDLRFPGTYHNHWSLIASDTRWDMSVEFLAYIVQGDLVTFVAGRGPWSQVRDFGDNNDSGPAEILSRLQAAFPIGEPATVPLPDVESWTASWLASVAKKSRPAGKAPPSTASRWTSRLLWGGVLSCAIGFTVWLQSAMWNAREAARRGDCKMHLKQLSLALLHYHDTYGTFPPAYVADADGNPMHSWRVLILPFIDELDVYRKYDFSQPWDSPHNRQLESAVHFGTPRFLQCPSVHAGKNPMHTNYVVLTGPETAFPFDKSTSLKDMVDGPETTILLVEVADTDIHWMEPRDLNVSEMSFVLNDPHHPSISSMHSAGSQMAFADQSVRFIGASLAPETLKAITTIAGGETVTNDDLYPKVP